MPGTRYLMAAVLLTVLTAAPLVRWPLGQPAAYAEGMDVTGGASLVRRIVGPIFGRTVSASNENERKDREERRDRGNNDNHGGDNNNNSDDDDNEDWTPPPPPRQQAAPPPPPPDQVGNCLSAGGSVTLDLSEGGVTAKVFQGGLYVQLNRVDPGSLPPPPGGLISPFIFRLSAAPCGGSELGALPGEGNLGVSYRNRVADGRDEGRFTLVFWDGSQWSPATKVATDPGNNFVSATVTQLGVYALVQR